MNGSNYFSHKDEKKPGSHGGVYVGHSDSHSHVVFGIIVLLFGVIFLLENLGVFYSRDIFHYWPIILIGVGIARIFDWRNSPNILWGVLITGIGAIFLAHSLGYLPWNIWRFLWPLALIGAGAVMLMRGIDSRGRTIVNPFDKDTSTISDNMLKEEVIFGGINRKIHTQDFLGGKATAIFGGVEIDLRGAATTKDEIRIEANAIFGGVELMLPDAWEVVVRGTGIMGGFEDKTYPAPAAGGVKRPRVFIQGSAILGGVTVRN
jgi:predicted membrane protein